MKNTYSLLSFAAGQVARISGRFARRPFAALAFAVAIAAVVTGCQELSPRSGGYDPAFLSTPGVELPAAGGSFSSGDTIRVTFANETNHNTVAKIQLDGTVTLPLVGEVPAAGFNAQSLKTNLTERYQRFLKGDEITVSLVTSAASIYISGAVLRPGKVPMDRPMTVLDAIMEAGGFDVRASTSKVVVLRLEAGRQQSYHVDLSEVMEGRAPLPFWLKPYDIIRVPERKVQF